MSTGKPTLGRAVVEQGALIRAARKRAGLTLQQACRALDISTAFLSDVECGRRLISPARLADIARAFGCSVDDIGGPRHLSRDLVLWLREQHEVVAVLVAAKERGCGVRLDACCATSGDSSCDEVDGWSCKARQQARAMPRPPSGIERWREKYRQARADEQRAIAAAEFMAIDYVQRKLNDAGIPW